MTKTILVCLSLGLMLGFWWGISQPKQPEKLPTKVIRFSDSSGTRYFLIGYAIGGSQRGNITWVAQSGKIPTNEQLLSDLHASKNVLSFKDKDFILLGLYEFKNEMEFNRFSELNQ